MQLLCTLSPLLTVQCSKLSWLMFECIQIQVPTCVVMCLWMTDGFVAPWGLGLLVLGSRKVSSSEPTVASPTCRSTIPLSNPKSTTCKLMTAGQHMGQYVSTDAAN